MSITITPLQDVEAIRAAMTHPRVYPHIADDSCPDAKDFQPVLDGPFVYLGAFDSVDEHDPFDEFEYLGLFMIHPHSTVLWEGHTCLLPNAWGPRSIPAAQAAIRWVFENTPCQRFVTTVPEGNPLALRLARKAGMTEYGRNPKSLQRGGILIDQTLLGLNKEEFTHASSNPNCSDGCRRGRQHGGCEQAGQGREECGSGG